jgi:hypothetical protein
MKTDTELEALLRETFAGRAQTVERAPALAAPAKAPRRFRPWIPALAAAAAVIVVAASIAIAKNVDRSAPARPSPSPTTSRPPAPTTCPASLPASWEAAVKHATLVPNGANLQPLAVSGNGTVLAVRGANPDTEQFTVAVVTPDRHVSPVVLQLGMNITADGRSPAINDRWAVFGTRNIAWTNDAILWAIDLQHGLAARKILDLTEAGATGGKTLQDWLLLGDNVYYTASDTYPSTHYRLYRYDLRTGTRTELAAGPRLTMHSVYGSLSYRPRPTPTTWGAQVVLVPGDMPSNVPAAVTDGMHTVVTDGTDVAWSELTRTSTGRHVQSAYWWAPGTAAPVLALQQRVQPELRDQPAFEVSSVAGAFVFVNPYDATGWRVLDTRTHANAPWTADESNAAWFAWAAGGGRVAIEYSGAKFGPNTTYVPDIASLPQLTCR